MQITINGGGDWSEPKNRILAIEAGQALSGLKEGPAIHPILHKFADEWRVRFGRTARALLK